MGRPKLSSDASVVHPLFGIHSHKRYCTESNQLFFVLLCFVFCNDSAAAVMLPRTACASFQEAQVPEHIKVILKNSGI